MAVPDFSMDAWARADEAQGSMQHVSISLPEQVFCWTRDIASQGGDYLYGEATGLRSMVPNPDSLAGANLNDGYPDAFVRKNESDESVPVDVIVRGAVYAGVQLDRATVVTFRNNLNKLLLTPLQPNDPWIIDATWHGQTLFLEIVKSPEQRQQPQGDNDRFTYYGYKFESICTGAEPTDPVDSTGEFAIMVQVRLGRHMVLMAAETDAWEPPPDDLDDPAGEYVGYVELKTFVLPQGDRAVERLYRDKYPRWWVQSYLAGVPTMVLGGRDRSGILRQIQRLPVTRLPALAHEAGFPFDAFRLLRFGDAALDWMCATAISRPGEHWRFEYAPGRRGISAAVVPGGTLPGRVVAALAGPQEGAQDAGDGLVDGIGPIGGELDD